MSKKLSKRKRAALLEERDLLLTDTHDARCAGDQGGLINEDDLHTKEIRLEEIEEKLEGSDFK